VKELVLTRAAVRALDRRAIEEYGIPSIVLMENAGRACALEALRLLGASGSAEEGCARSSSGRARSSRRARATSARTSRSGAGSGRRSRAWRRPPRSARSASRAAKPGSWSTRSSAPATSASERKPGARRYTTETPPPAPNRPELEDPWRALIRLVNAARRPVLAVDLPSGLDADTGAELGAAVRADLTVTFVAQKPGFLAGRGPELCGRVVVAEIGIPRPWLEAARASGP
jgi:NAD(P)H-hydrate epimerase